MGIREKAKFVLEKDKCVKCGKCINTCSGMVLEFGKDGYPYMKDFERFGWRGCWRCQHCLAVCPTGAISILGKKPEARKMLGIPKEHYMGLIIGFGYPEIEYSRGVQKDRGNKVHRYSLKH